MATVYTAKAPVEIIGVTIYPDSSGCPGVVRVADFSFAADFIGGEMRIHCIKSPNAGRCAGEVAAERARRSFAAYVNENTTAEWRAANVAMYAD